MSKIDRRLIAAAIMVAVVATSLPAAAATHASEEQIQAMRTQADWIDQIAARMEQRGKMISDADARTIRMINGQLTRFERILRATADRDKGVVLLEDALAVQDQLAQVWGSLRGHRGEAGDAMAALPGPTGIPAASLTLPSGTRAIVQLTTWLSSKNAEVGDRFSVLLADPVYAGGKIAIPAGAVFEGFVTEVDRAGRASDAGKLHLFIDRLRGSEGQIADVRGLIVGTASGDDIKGRGVSGEKAAVGGVVGAVIGGLLDGKKGALIGAGVGAGGTILAEKGKNVDLPQGTLLRLELQDAVVIPWTWAQ